MIQAGCRQIWRGGGLVMVLVLKNINVFGTIAAEVF
jgi:hypothetical protein